MADGRRASSAEGIIITLLVLFVTTYASLWAARARFPQMDFFVFRGVAAHFAAGESPSNFKTAPLFSAVMAAGSFVAPGRDPFLTTARAANVIAAAAGLILFFFWSRPVLGRWAAVAAAWLAAASLYTVYGWAPISDMFTLALILAVLCTRRGWGRYVLATLAALARFEVMALAIALGIMDAWDTRSWKWVAFAAAACLPSLAWLVVPYLMGKTVLSYIDQYRINKPSGWAFIGYANQVLFQTRAPILRFAGYLAGAAAAAGLFYAGWKRRGTYGAAAAFLPVYFTAHMAFPWGLRRYFLSVLPLAVFGMWVIVITAGRRLYKARRLAGGAAVIGFIAAGATLAGVAVGFARGAAESSYVAAGFTLLLIAAAVVAAARSPWDWRRVGMGLLIAPVAAAFAAKSAATAWDDYHYEQAGITLRGAAEYLDRAAPGTKVATSSPVLLGYYMNDGGRRLVSVDELGVKGYDDLATKLRRAGATYVVADGTTCGTEFVAVGPRPAARALQPLYDGKAGPPYRLVKVIETKYEKSLIYRLE